MSFDRRFELPTFNDDVDLTECETCQHKDYDFTCGQIGYCIKKCGEGYVIGSILMEKGYGQVNTDWFRIDDVLYDGLELSKRECKKLKDNLEKLGYNSTLHHHPLQKRSLNTIIIDSHRPIELCHVFQKLDVIK